MRYTQRKGDIAVSRAIATFTKMGYDVLLPLTESTTYDLVIDKDNSLHKIQVKYSNDKNGDIDLRNIHSNSKGYVIRKYKQNDFDWLYVLDGNNYEYLIKDDLSGRRSIRKSVEYII